MDKRGSDAKLGFLGKPGFFGFKRSKLLGLQTGAVPPVRKNSFFHLCELVFAALSFTNPVAF